MTSGNPMAQFGDAVRRARIGRGWTLEKLAHEALGNQERKSYVSAVEKGLKRLADLSIQRFAKALDLPHHIVNAALGFTSGDAISDAAAEQTVVALASDVENLRRELKLSESLVIALAWEFAEGNPADRDTALRGLRRALEVARDMQTERQRGTNLGGDVDAVLKRLEELTAAGDLEEAGEEANRAIGDWEDKQSEMTARGLMLLQAGIDQDYLRRDAAGIAAKLIRKTELDLPAGASLFAALWAVQDEWYVRGRNKGLNLDLEVSVHLARNAHDSAKDADQRGAALNDAGISLRTLGQRENGAARLQEAVTAYNEALKERTRQRVPLDWAGTLNNLGNALRTLGERESGTARLQEAVTAFTEALKELTRQRVPLDWATTQNNLGNALQTLGERESSPARLEEAVTAYTEALKEWTRERVPLDWATTQNNLGAALQTLGQRESGAARLQEALTAYTEALKERTRERVPFDWAQTRENMALAWVAMFEKTADPAHLTKALDAVDDALSVYREAKAPHYLGKAEHLRARILGLQQGK